MNVELEDIIKNAIAQGETSYEFYLQMANVVTLKETRETFEFLARVEQEHNHSLQSFMKPEELGKTVFDEDDVAWIEEESLRLLGMIEPPVGATLHSGGTLTDDVYRLSPTESLLIAVKREEISCRLYQTLAAQQPPGKPRSVLERISRMKSGLKEKLEYLYNNAAFVEVW